MVPPAAALSPPAAAEPSPPALAVPDPQAARDTPITAAVMTAAAFFKNLFIIIPPLFIIRFPSEPHAVRNMNFLLIIIL